MEKTISILTVEDDRDLREMIDLAGQKRGYRMISAGNGIDARQTISSGQVPDVIILDINMPGMDGFSFCRWLREDHALIPVIFLSARVDEYDKILALEIGGDDYLTKPFSIKELFARVAVSLRRIRIYRNGSNGVLPSRVTDNDPGELSDKKVVLDDLAICPGLWSCTYRGHSILLTVSEFRILYKLAAHPDMVFSRDILAKTAFPEDQYNVGRSIDIHISRIRKKLQKVNPDFQSIETVYQVGYKWTR